MTRTRGGAALDERPSGAAEAEVEAEATGRRLRRQARRRQRRWILFSAVLVLGLAIAGPALRRHLSEKNASDAPARHARTTASKPVAVPLPKTVLVLHAGPDGRADLAMLGGLSNDSKEAAILLLPTGSQIQTPSLGLQTIADLPRLGDTALVQTTVENLLGIRIAKTVVLGDLQLLAAANAAGPLDVSFADAVHVQDGSQVFAYPAGSQKLLPGDVARIVGRLETGDELAHLKTLQTVFAPWFAALKNPTVHEAAAVSAPDLGRFVDVAAADPKMLTLPVQAAATGGGAELYRVDRAALADITSTRFGDAVMANGRRPKVQLLNGTGAVGVAQQVARCVVPSGYEVALTDNVKGFGVKSTSIVAQQPSDLATARKLVKLLGVGTARRAAKPNDLVDVSVVIGADFHGCPSDAGG